MGVAATLAALWAILAGGFSWVAWFRLRSRPARMGETD